MTSLNPDKDLELATLSNLFKTIGDPVRLRLLHLLCAQELSVGELVRIVELPQSSVSRHLKALREEGLIADRPVGPTTFYRASLEAELGRGETALRDSISDLMKGTELPPADRAGLDRVLALREAEGEAFFDRIGIQWDYLREDCFGSTFHLEVFLRLLPHDFAVADLGTGTGYLLPVLGRHFRNVIGVDNNSSMLELARRRVADEGVTNVELREGNLEELPIGNQEAGLAIALLMMHHLPRVEPALAEIARILQPGGRLLMVEIHPHTNEAFRVRMGDRRMGIDPLQMRKWMADAGFSEIQIWDLPQRERPEHELAPLPRIYGAIGVKKQKIGPA